MRGYRDLFEREFAADPRLFDLAGGGLPLGITTLSPETAWEMLAETGAGETGRETPGHPGTAADQAALTERVRLFLGEEKELITLVRAILTGGAEDPGKLSALIDECDYLWAHFPDYAGAGGRRPGAEELASGSPAAISFLKRLRAEIDPALSLIERTMGELER